MDNMQQGILGFQRLQLDVYKNIAPVTELPQISPLRRLTSILNMTSPKDLNSHINSTTASTPDQQDPSTSPGTSLQTNHYSEELQELLIAIQLDINMYSADNMAGRTLRKSLLSLFGT